MQAKHTIFSKLPASFVSLLKYIDVRLPSIRGAFHRIAGWWQQHRENRIIKTYNQFDPDYYLSTYPQVALDEKWGKRPFEHYLRYGVEKGFSPRAGFDPVFYLQHNSDVASFYSNPFAHYLKFGFAENRLPCKNADLFFEWCCFNRYQRRPNLIKRLRQLKEAWYIYNSRQFSTLWYWGEYPDVRKVAEKSLWWKYRFSRNRALYKMALSLIHPIHHFVRYGVLEGRCPNTQFDPQFYIRTYVDVRSSLQNPFVHYLKYGANENRLPGNGSLRDSSMAEMGFDDNSKYNQPQKSLPNAFKPRISVVVPNYNHEKYLKQRLDSIYDQTYNNMEVILLDDGSNDGSCRILTEYAEKYPSITRVCFNEKNSGNVFGQWAKGIEMARGDIVWISESDDYCDLDFLEKLVPFFRDEAVMAAYSNVNFVDQDNNPSEFAYLHYLSPVGPKRWKSSHTSAAFRTVEKAFGVLNIIPNASGCIFRRRPQLALYNDPQWLNMRICGDWVFYLHQICGGKLSYCVDTCNYFRFHQNNSSKKTYSTSAYYREHEMVARTISRLYSVPGQTLEASRNLIYKFWEEHAQDDLKEAGFETFYRMDRVAKARQNCQLNILIGVYSFSSGGGEVLPIRLANALFRMGENVTVLEFSPNDRNENIRMMLDKAIPLVTCPDLYKLRQCIRDFGIDIFNSHHTSLQVLFADAFPDENRPLHIAVTHGLFDTMSKRDLEACMEKIYRHTDHWVYVADKNLIPFNQAGVYQQSCFTKLPNGIDQQKVTPVSRASLGISEDAFVLCLVSRAMADKGWEEAIEIVKAARQYSKKDIQLLLVGDGPIEEKLRKINLPDFIYLTGFKQNPLDYFSAADMGFLPSRYRAESAPLVVIESLFAGKPVIASNLGEIKTMIDWGDGQLAGAVFDLKNWKIPIDKAARLVAEFAEDRTRLSQATQLAKRLSGKYDIREIARKYRALFQTCHHEAISCNSEISSMNDVSVAGAGPTLKGAGICPVCHCFTEYSSYDQHNDWFNSYRCRYCNALPRDRAVQHCLDEYYPGWRYKVVHECSPSNDLLEKAVEDYSASQYYPDGKPGEKIGKFFNENLESMTFKENSFDFFVALEVFEHLFDPERAVKEMVRCTRPGGAVVFTTCPGPGKTSRPRAEIDRRTGNIIHLLDPVYHGNPIGNGALLTWDFGQDLFELVEGWSSITPIIMHRVDETIGLPRGGLPCVFMLPVQ